jgi:hypothetical protein
VTVSETRAALGFVAAVRENFGFLADYGFREIKATTFIVDFDSEAVRMRIGHEPLAYELSANFARMSHPDEMTSSVSYGRYLKLVDPEAAADYRDFVATTPEAVSHGVAELAAEVRTATPLLTGDDVTYDELAHLGMLAEEHLAASTRRNAYGQRAEAAWQAKDWPEVVEAYSRYENDLSEGERRRLDLARRRAAGDGS